MDNKALIFDSHSHYDDQRYNETGKEILSSMKEKGVGSIITCGTDLASSKNCISLAEQFDIVYAAVGCHPTCIEADTVFDNAAFEKLIEHPKVVAIGEIGLDYYWDTSLKEKQLELFETQLDFANRHFLPVSVHDREAHFDTLNLLKKYKPKGVVHCFSGSVEMAQEIISLGMCIGVGGVITFKNSKKKEEVVKAIPLEFILLETDAPYLTPEPNRKEINNSAYIYFVAQKIAKIKQISTDAVLAITNLNSKKLFGIV